MSQRFIKQCDIVVNEDLDYREAVEEERPEVEFRVSRR